MNLYCWGGDRWGRSIVYDRSNRRRAIVLYRGSIILSRSRGWGRSVYRGWRRSVDRGWRRSIDRSWSWNRRRVSRLWYRWYIVVNRRGFRIGMLLRRWLSYGDLRRRTRTLLAHTSICATIKATETMTWTVCISYSRRPAG